MADQEYLEKERAAINAVNEIAEKYGESLAFVWHWGNGNGTGIMDAISEKIISLHDVKRDSFALAQRKSQSKANMDASLRLKVYERDGYQCLHCGVRKDLSLDHIHPESKGGATTLENLQTLCRSCNSKKGVSL